MQGQRPDRRDHARGWLLKGDSDLRTAQLVLAGDGPYDTACFHAQQAVEKYLKALLAYAGRPVPRTHNLEDLVGPCESLYPNLDQAEDELSELTPFAVELRYDFEFWPSRDDTADAIGTVDQVRRAVLAVLPPDVHP
jgi:HEPN domain-containing protein